MRAGIVPFDRYPGLPPLFHDFLRGLPEFYPDDPTLEAAAERGRELLTRGRRGRIPPAAFRFRGAAAREMAESLAEGRAVAVLAGHQVGLFTGPLFTVTKAFDAIRVARELSRRGVPAAPVFWALTDDHDLEEVARTARPGPAGPEILVLEGADRSNRSPVGRLPIPARIGEIVEAFRPDARSGEAEEILRQFARRSSPGIPYGEAFIETLLDLVGTDPLLVIDPLSEELRGETVAFFLAAVQSEKAIRETLAETAERLREGGRETPVPIRAGLFPFFAIQNGERRRVEDTGDAAGRALAGTLWPSSDVLTRPGLKSYLLPVAASILGAAEIAYHVQVLPLLPLFGLERPVLLPRSHLVLRGPAERRAAQALGLAAEELLSQEGRQDPANPPEAADLEDLALRVGKELAALSPRLAVLDPSLVGALETVQRKVTYQFEQLGEKMRKAAERRDEIVWKRRTRLETMLRPNGIPAERLYPPLVPMLAWGRAGLDAIREAAVGSAQGGVVVELGESEGEEMDRHAG